MMLVVRCPYRSMGCFELAMTSENMHANIAELDRNFDANDVHSVHQALFFDMLFSKFNHKIVSNFCPVFSKCFHMKTEWWSPCSKDLKSCGKKDKIGALRKTRCAATREALANCPRKSDSCASKNIAGLCTTKIENPADLYITTRRMIKLRSSELTNFLETSTNSILTDMRKQMESTNLQDLDTMRRILCSLDKNMDLLMKLNVKCAGTTKLKVLKLNDRVAQSILASDKSAQVAYTHIDQNIKDLAIETCNKIQSVMSTITLCRMSTSPKCLEDCIESKRIEATEQLDELDQSVRNAIAILEQTKDDLISDRKRLSKYISREYQQQTSLLSREVSEYIKCFKSR